MAQNGSSKALKIRQQVEYYFGDLNLPRDKFLQDEIKKDDGWVGLTTMLQFNRLKQISDDVDEISTALKDSSLIEVAEDQMKIRRKPDAPVPENTLEYWQEVKTRTVYAKGFPLDTSLDDIETFMKQFGDIKNVVMRRVKLVPRTFKGSIFATFADKETAQRFVQNPDVKDFKGAELVKLMQEDYWASKAKQVKEKRNAEKMIKQVKKSQVNKDNKHTQFLAEFLKGLVLKLEGFGAKPELAKVKAFFTDFGNVSWVTIVSEKEVTIRFSSSTENEAQKAWNKTVAAAPDGKVVFDGSEISGKVLEGEEEQKYWVDFNKSKVERAERTRSNRKGKFGGRDAGKGKSKDWDTQKAVKEEENMKPDATAPRGEKRPASTDAAATEPKSKKIVFNEDEEGDAVKAESDANQS